MIIARPPPLLVLLLLLLLLAAVLSTAAQSVRKNRPLAFTTVPTTTLDDVDRLTTTRANHPSDATSHAIHVTDRHIHAFPGRSSSIGTRLVTARLSSSSVITSPPTAQDAHDDIHNELGCDCMEYWKCVMSGGSPYSYCGLSSSSVCCFSGVNAKPISLIPSGAPPPIRCGRKGHDATRQGQAALAEWRWHAAVLEKPDDLYVCGATLVDQSWVLTAAHCVDDYLSRPSRVSEVLKVRLGEYDVTTTTEPLRHEEFDVASVELYPTFDNSTLEHDIALLRLSKPARRRQHIDVVCLPRPGDFGTVPQGSHDEEHECVVTGWGRRSESADHSVILKEVPVPIWANEDCEKALRNQFGPDFRLPDTAVCAGAEGRDACDGDGGGPLVCLKGSRWYQVGVVSFGVGCGRPHMPGVYTRVAMYERWIRDTVLRHRQQ